MPVPRLRRTVTLNPLPGVRVTAAETPASEGAGLALAQARTAEAAAGVASGLAQVATSEAAKIAEHAQRQADQTVLLAADNSLADWEHQRLYDPEKGALNVKGKDVLALQGQVTDEFNQQADAAAASLPERLRLPFAQMRAQRHENLDLTILRHTSEQMQAYTAGETQAGIDNARNAAVANALDPHRVAQELDRGVTILQTQGPTLGLGPQQIAKQVDSFTSSVHVGVIDRLLANDHAPAAQAYYDVTKDQIAGEALAKVEAALEEGGLRKSSQQQADAIVAAGGTLTEQLAKVRGIDDAKVRDAVQERVEHAHAVQDAQERQDDEDRSKLAFTYLDQTHGDLHAIPPALWNALSGGTRASLSSYAKSVANPEANLETDWKLWYQRINEAGDDPTAFAARNLWNDRAALAKPQFEQLASLQLSLKHQDTTAADHQLAGFRTSEQIITDSLTQYGIDPKDPAHAAAVAKLRRMVDLQVETLQHSTGKKVTNVDIQDLVDVILSVRVDVPGSWWNILPGGHAGPWGVDSVPFVHLTIGDVPAADRQLIETALRATGRSVSDATVLDYYLKAKLLARIKR